MNDWREDLLYTMTDTRGCSFQQQVYQSTERSDHEHCSICFEKISNCAYGQGETQGYYCQKTGDWLCVACFNDFKNRFGWKIDVT